MKTCDVGEYKNCVELQSGDFSIAVSQNFGPRVIGGWIKGSNNIFQVLAPTPMKSVNTGFTLYGGHRLWISPEIAPRTYSPDNEAVNVDAVTGGFKFKAKPEAISGVQKSVTITKLNNNRFSLKHEITNCGQWDVTFACWALSIMAPGGVAIIPQARDIKRDPYTPDRPFVLWPYTSIADKRLVLEDEYIMLRQDSKATSAAKIGFFTNDGWIAYVNQGVALVKHIKWNKDVKNTFPDNGCNVESYSCKSFCEIETLSPLNTVKPGESIVHTEIWQAIADLPEIKNTKDIKKYLVPKLNS